MKVTEPTFVRFIHVPRLKVLGSLGDFCIYLLVKLKGTAKFGNYDSFSYRKEPGDPQ